MKLTKMVLWLIFLSPALQADLKTRPSVRILSEQLSFQYMSNDGSVTLGCKHSQIQDLPDWEVVCGKGTPQEKRYTVHFVAHEYQRPVSPPTTFEFLYWVTEKNSQQQINTSNSFWINLREKTSLQSIRLHQGVENDSAALIADYSP